MCSSQKSFVKYSSKEDNHIENHLKNIMLEGDFDEYLSEYRLQTPVDSTGHYEGEFPCVLLLLVFYFFFNK